MVGIDRLCALKHHQDDGLILRCKSRLQASPGDHNAFCTVADRLLKRRKRSQLWQLCSELLGLGVLHAYIPSAMVHAASTATQKEMAAKLMDPGAWVSERKLVVSEAFNIALSDELMSHPRLQKLSGEQATVGVGQRIDALEYGGGPVVEELLFTIGEAIGDYLHERAYLAPTGIFSSIPRHAGLHAWASLLSADAHETWHVHARGWVSGVYYLRTPSLESVANGNAGDIEFGAIPFGDVYPDKWLERRIIKPTPGTLLLFPSYFGHHTWASESPDTRICVAFDVTPRRPAMSSVVNPRVARTASHNKQVLSGDQ
jgi:hypothetical protein